MTQFKWMGAHNLSKLAKLPYEREIYTYWQSVHRSSPPMSTRRPQEMVSAVLEKFSDNTTTFRCEFCGLTHDDERPNCPACGGPLRRE